MMFFKLGIALLALLGTAGASAFEDARVDVPTCSAMKAMQRAARPKATESAMFHTLELL